MAEIIKADGTRTTVVPDNGKTFKLEQCQKIVGGLIEVLYLPGRKVMILNEEGKVHGLPRNDVASETTKGSGLMPGDYIVGDVLVCDNKEFK
ncbi:MAG: DUF3846 domain-containing protein [Dehalococcoidia bacterium]|nr:DUF3846 domain-containing protein [Dehalococcoidia bacterium]